MTIFPEISRRARDKYHNLKDDDIMKNIFNSGRHKDKVGMQIPAWMISEEMKQTEHYRMYAEVFGIDVPLTQSQPTESTQGTHRTPSAPRSPNPNKEAAESSAPRRSTVIRLRIPERRSTRLTPPAPVPNVDKADEMILQDTLQVSLAEHKSREEQEARENVALVDEHLASEEIKKMVDGQENVVDDSSIPRNDESNIPGTRIEPRSNKESPEVEITKDKEVEITKETLVVDITNVVIPVNVNDEDEEITDEVYELKRREKGKIVEETRNSPIPTLIRSARIHSNLVSSDTEKLQELMDTHTTSSSSSPNTKLSKTNRLLSLFKTKPTHFKRSKSFFQELQGRYGYLFAHLRARFMPRKSFDTLADNLHDVMVETLPTMVDKHIKEQVMKQVPEQVQNQVPVIQCNIVIPSQVDASVRSYMSGHILYVLAAQSQTSSVPDQQYQLYLAMKADPQLQQQDIDKICWTLQMNVKRQKTSEYKAYVSRESSSGQVFQEEQAPSTSGNSGPKKDSLVTSTSFLWLFFNDNDLKNKLLDGNPHAKIFYIRKQKEPGKPKEEVYSNSKIIQVVKTYWELGHEHKFITEIVARRANKYRIAMSLSVFIRSTVIWERVHDFQLRIESYQQKVNLTAPTMTFPGIEDHEMFSIIYEPVHGIIYKNSKKEKWVMRHSEIHKFCDATLNRVLEGLKSYNNDIKYGYVQKDLTKDEAEYLKLFEEEIEERLKHRRQMRR
ncbi:hypothetical protein Tco_0651821 [Tanacetum coccineum]|uniref:Uncharacterized protein n=1 Tax=Tanacetum coccineum TaxID=301880 RepID=A0ABQ4WVZ5_9ASTR